MALSNDRHQLGAHSSRSALVPEMLSWHRAQAHQARRPIPADGPLDGRAALAVTDLEIHPLVGWVWDCVNPGFFALFLAEPKRSNERHRRSTSGVGADDGASP